MAGVMRDRENVIISDLSPDPIVNSGALTPIPRCPNILFAPLREAEQSAKWVSGSLWYDCKVGVAGCAFRDPLKRGDRRVKERGDENHGKLEAGGN